MPDLLEPADSRSGNRALAEAANGTTPFEESGRAIQTAERAAQAAQVESPPVAPAHPLLILERVSKWYGPVIGVNQVTLELRAGITGLVGPNGAGKTTLMRLATGQLRPDIGTVRLHGRPAWSPATKRYVGYCPEIDSFYEEMSGRRFIQSLARLCGYSRREAHSRAEETLGLVGMAEHADRRLRGYSKGMRQRIKVAQALLHDPDLLVLDEPLSGIDPVGRQEFVALFQSLAEQGKCLLISSHELEELEKLTDYVAVMTQGRIAAVGTLPQIRELLDHHPLSILIASDQPRQLAGSVLAMEDVVGVELGEQDTLIVRARNPRRLFQQLTGLVLEENVDIRHLEALDESAHAILGYLLGSKR
jgi:ABC-2 type transport system ATP-binding protein